MKPIPTFSKSEHQLLRELAKNNINTANSKDIMRLNEELDRGVILKDETEAQNFIRLNSKVTVEDFRQNEMLPFRLYCRRWPM